MQSLTDFLEAAVDDTRYRIGAVLAAIVVLAISGGFLLAANNSKPHAILNAPVLPEHTVNLPIVRMVPGTYVAPPAAAPAAPAPVFKAAKPHSQQVARR